MNPSIPSLAEALTRSDQVHARATIDAAIERMAVAIRNDYAGQRPLFLTMMNGGMIFAGQLALALGIDCEFDYLHATRYRGATQGSGLRWLRQPENALDGKSVLLVDDILDEGPTLHAVREWCRKQGAAEVKIAVLTWKRHDRCIADLEPDYVGLDVPDRYVYGFGMDYYEQGRNLPAIYALK